MLRGYQPKSPTYLARIDPIPTYLASACRCHSRPDEPIFGMDWLCYSPELPHLVGVLEDKKPVKCAT